MTKQRAQRKNTTAATHLVRRTSQTRRRAWTGCAVQERAPELRPQLLLLRQRERVPGARKALGGNLTTTTPRPKRGGGARRAMGVGGSATALVSGAGGTACLRRAGLASCEEDAQGGAEAAPVLHTSTHGLPQPTTSSEFVASRTEKTRGGPARGQANS